MIVPKDDFDLIVEGSYITYLKGLDHSNALEKIQISAIIEV